MPRVPLPEQRVMAGPAADLRTNVAPVEDRRGAALAGLGQAVQQVGQRALDQGLELELANQRKAHQEEAQSAFNRATLAAGERTIQYQSLKGPAATPEEYEKYRKDIANIYDQHGSTLSARAAEMYKPESDSAKTAHLLNGGRHYQQQFEITTEQTRQATVALAGNEAAADPMGFVGSDAMRRGLETIASNPKLTAEEVKVEQLDFSSKVTTAAVNRLIDQGNLRAAQASYEGAKANGMVSSPAQASIEEKLKRAGQSAEDQGYVVREVGAVLGELERTVDTRDLTPADLITKLDPVRDTIQNDPGLSQEDKDRREARFERIRGDIIRKHTAQMDQDKDRYVPAMAASTSLEEADRVIEKAPKWMQYSLEQMKLQLFKHLLPTQADSKKAEKVQSPDAVAQVEAAISYLMGAGAYKTVHHLRQALASAGLPDYSQKRMVDIFENGGPKGLTQDDVFKQWSQMGKVDMNDLKEWETRAKLMPLYHFVRDGLPPDKDASPENIQKLLDQYAIKVAYTDIKGKGLVGRETGMLGEAVSTGRPFVVADPALVAMEKERLKAAGVNPDPTKTVTRVERPGVLANMFNDIFNGPLATGRPGNPLQPKVVSQQVPDEADPDALETQNIVNRLFNETLGYLPPDFVRGEGGTFSLPEARQRRVQRIADRVKAAQEKR